MIHLEMDAILLSGSTSDPTVYFLSHCAEFHGRRISLGPRSIVSSDVDLFRTTGAKIGFQSNVCKCAVVSKALFNPESSLAGFVTMRPTVANLR